MSYHILHIFQHGAMLGKERGFVTCKGPEDAQPKRMPLEDLRAVIIAARGVTMSSNFIASVVEQDGIILHCDESYQARGVTAPLQRVIDQKAFLNQCARPRRLNEKLWTQMLRGKTVNQTKVLNRWDIRSAHLERALEKKAIDEGNCAKRYWQLYFPSIGWQATRRDRKENTAPNQMLNYGYTVLAALCHRSLIVHGLTPSLGVHHTTRYQSDPLVYDLMEAFRPMVDCLLAEFMTEPDVTMRSWCKKVGTELRARRVQRERYSLKLMDALDASASSLARSYAALDAGAFWVPELE